MSCVHAVTRFGGDTRVKEVRNSRLVRWVVPEESEPQNEQKTIEPFLFMEHVGKEKQP